MATESVTPQSSRCCGYQLPPEHRAAILAGSDSAQQIREIERQRQDFIQKNGEDMPNLLAH